MAIGTENWVCPRCGTRVDIAPLGLYAEVSCPTCGHTQVVHAQLGNFLLEGVLGIGGMSVVYRAMDVVLNRPLAIKVLNDTFRDQPERIERFENESSMMARVRHKNVTSVYSAGRAFGQFYIAMELVEGTNLEHMVSAARPLDTRQALGIIRSVAEGLEAAHKAGLLHRDMKPGNILITPEGDAKVIDFGLAVDSKEGDTEEIIWATPYYVPPETLERQPEDVRTDIYALGMTLRYLLTGVESFDGPADSLSALVACKRKQPSFAKQCPYAPSALCELVDHMTAFSPGDRPKNYAQLIEEIDEVQAEVENQILLNINPIDHKLSQRRAIFWALIGSFAFGVLLAAYLHPSKVIIRQKYVELDTDVSQKDERDKLSDAMKLLGSNRAAAADRLMKLATQADEPCIGAWSALLAKLVYYSMDDTTLFRSQEAQRQLMRHWENGDDVTPAGERFFAYMHSLIDPRRYPTNKEWETGNSEWEGSTLADLLKQEKKLTDSTAPEVLNFISWYILAEQAAWLGADDLNRRCLERSRSAATSLTIYKPLANLLFASAAEKPDRQSWTPMATAERLMQQHHFAEAKQRFAAVAADTSLSAAERDRSLVYSEVCEVAAELVQTLNRLYPDRYHKGMSAEELSKIIVDSPLKISATADGSDGSYTPGKVIDGDTYTRWRAADNNAGHYLDLSFSQPTRISHIEVTWDNNVTQKVNVRFSLNGEGSERIITKNADTSVIDAPPHKLSNIRFTFNDVARVKWAGIREVTVHSIESVLKKEALALGLLVEGRTEAAESIIRQLSELNRQAAPFDVLAKDWINRLEQTSAPTRQTEKPSASPAPQAASRQASDFSSEAMKIYREQPTDPGKIINMCRDCVLIEPLPDKKISLENSTSLSQGQMTICPRELANELVKREVAMIHNDKIVPLLGFKTIRSAEKKFTIYKGVIQPCMQDLADMAEAKGWGKIVLSTKDLEGMSNKLNDDPFPQRLKRSVTLPQSNS